MSRPLRVEDGALRELEAAVRWYEDRIGGLGGRFLAAVDLTIMQIRDFPGTGTRVPRVAPEIDVRRFPVSGFPYHVVYLEADDALWALAFAHDRRRPGYWTARSGPIPH